MFKRKLTALNYHSPELLNYENEQEFRNFITWLENQKIRFYKIEDRIGLDNVENPQWTTVFNKYLDDLKCPLNKDDRISLIEWLLSVAVKYEFEDNMEKYNNIRQKATQSGRKSENVLDNLDFNSAEFKDGLTKIRTLLNVPPKPDDSKTVLLAVSKLINEKLNPDVVKTALSQTTSDSTKDQIAPLSIQSMSLGFDTNDYVINEAAKILRLLYINDLRKLQTKINETIVTIQTITANPKTDSSLGKVGF